MSSLPPGPSRYVPASRKRSNQATDVFEAHTLEALHEKENRHLSFFKGILPLKGNNGNENGSYIKIKIFRNRFRKFWLCVKMNIAF